MAKVFKQYEKEPPEPLVNVFARVPKSLREEIDQIRANEEKSVYEMVEIALKMLVSRYKKENDGAIPVINPMARKTRKEMRRR